MSKKKKVFFCHTSFVGGERCEYGQCGFCQEVFPNDKQVIKEQDEPEEDRNDYPCSLSELEE